MPPAPASRVALAPLEGASEATLTEAAMTLPDALDGRDVRVGETLDAGALRLVVTRTTPAGVVRVSRASTELALAPQEHARSVAERRLVFDLLVMVDASWTMGKARADRPAPFTLVRPTLEPFVQQAGDLVRHAALMTFNAEPVLRRPFGPIAALQPSELDEVRPRGRTSLSGALDVALGTLADGADARNRHAVVLFTDDAEVDQRLPGVAERAARLGVAVHVVDVGDEPSDGLRGLARTTRGVYAFMPDGATLGPVFRALAAEVDAPFEWQEPPERGASGEAEFEVVLRQMDDDERR